MTFLCFDIYFPAVDRIPPQVVCPDDITQTVILPITSARVTWQAVTATDNSGVVEFVSSSHNSGDTFTQGTTTVTYSYRDGSGNTASCFFTVTIITGKLTYLIHF